MRCPPQHLFLSAAGFAGGAVLLAALAFGGTLGGVIYGAIPLRAALLSAAAAAFMPRIKEKNPFPAGSKRANRSY